MISVAFRLPSSSENFFNVQESFNVYIMEMLHSSPMDDTATIAKKNFL